MLDAGGVPPSETGHTRHKPKRFGARSPTSMLAMSEACASNVVSLPALVIPHQFAPRSFDLLLGRARSGVSTMAAAPTLSGLDEIGARSASLWLRSGSC